MENNFPSWFDFQYCREEETLHLFLNDGTLIIDKESYEKTNGNY